MNQRFFSCFILFHRIGTFFHSNHYVFIVEHLGAAITFFNSFVFASFNCKCIQFQFPKKILLVFFVFISINLKDKCYKIYFSETLGVLECKLCQLSNAILKSSTIKSLFTVNILPAVLKKSYNVNATDTIYYSCKVGLVDYDLVYLREWCTTVTYIFLFLLPHNCFLATKADVTKVCFSMCIQTDWWNHFAGAQVWHWT